MATRPRSSSPARVHYPTRDGKPAGETPVHRDILHEMLYLLRRWFEADPMAYVSGNVMMCYVDGDRRKHLSPDVFVTRGIPDDGRSRKAYFVWEEGKGPDFVVELTSKSTRREDVGKKFELYRDVLRVAEYFLFDPYGKYLKPPLKGYRLVEGRYEPIEPVDGRLPSEVTGLHLEPAVENLRLFDPATGQHLITSRELPVLFDRTVRELQADRAAERAEYQRMAGEMQALVRESLEVARRAEADRAADRAEIERLRRENEGLRRRPPEG